MCGLSIIYIVIVFVQEDIHRWSLLIDPNILKHILYQN
jgi:hypothetical protein